ncbi:uncharacterized protein LOC127137662 [Lathyrus oleraceus]|uniref:uncharacterized protein LOC127137662 n=1 Tax=Pisum sativum TaxID=3888 RepID=UPI0021D07126|nr:uncharacterized protein LOC127137662 [Pisum sativum]
MVLTWIHRSISESIAKSVLWIESAASVWKNLQLRFSQGDVFCISDIQEDLYKFPQGTLDVSNYFTQLKVMWDELENYRPIPACCCSIPCSCGAIASIRKYREQDYVIRFLKGLNKKFAHSKSQIMMMNPLPDVDKAFSLVIQQEREMSSAGSVIPNGNSSDEVTAFQLHITSGNSNGKSGHNNYKGKAQGQGGTRGQNRVCTHCGRTNHTVETCFIKHGYPPGFKGKGKSQNNTTQYQSAASVLAGTDESQPSSGFTQEQYNSILELIQQSKTTPKVNSITTSPFVLNSHS